MSLGSLYQPLFYPENTHGSTSQYWTSQPIEACRSQALAPPPPQGVPTVPAASPVASASVRTPRWDTWSPPREESQSPAEDRGEEVWEPEDLRRMGYLDSSGSWRCRYEGCRSNRVFVRACDLRKHFRGHDKYFFCTERPCAIAGVGFSTKKDYQRHMGSHQPTIKCPHPDCGRIFSRKDNMSSKCG
ncbi:C2H2 type zinc finger domain-containing protein [Colletotrichum graminicola M1.001]|uniref:C2H2 type zinc finger domain-containing protein n=1 Tax=Colletotrichum graminicola (strain M1.001 / M2 / FGSC 10212) TaxID=645133 RepID=E3QSS4_COLGM|nr:C2H2 type zinc finger domain-containing protein [Colletotrichum graminicola M1.001]EFQ33912.1 C2H2 type zinc finger domain-containing protein [Colletotrichum graminicola M1.001]